MMTQIKLGEFKYYGKAVGKQRARYSSKTNRFYTPQKTVDAEDLIAMTYRTTGGKKSNGAVAVEIWHGVSVERASTKKDRAAKLLGKLFPLKKPDIDNTLKLVLDALKGSAYNDDVQVCGCNYIRTYTEQDVLFIRVYEYVWKDDDGE